MEQLFIFTALVQAALITLVLGIKASRRDLPAMLFFLLMVNYTLVLFLSFWNINSIVQLSKLHMPIGYASGPFFYYFVRFSFFPNKKVPNKKWLLWFIPFVIEFSTASAYWLLNAFNSPFSVYFKDFANAISRWNFFYFIGFFIATIVFLVRHNPLITMNMVYKKQLKYLKYFMFFVALFIVDQIFSGAHELFYSSLLSCGFTSAFIYIFLCTSRVFSKQNDEGKELLKEALNEAKKAILITNKDRIVEYVNEPFLQMVGYRHRDVIGRKPSFLQGALTTPESVRYMRQKLSEEVGFQTDIINYRKNGEAYLCRVAITPIFSENKLTHFIAIEEEIETLAEVAYDKDELLALEKIKNHFKNDAPYKNKQLQVADIVEATGVPARRVGELLKKYENLSFSEFVNNYRVNTFIEMMQNPEHQHITMEALSQMCGFNSKSVFHATFKKVTGQTPKHYLEPEKES
jgi:PAS domain S-box-containing protein